MFVVGNFFLALAKVLGVAIKIYMVIVILSAVSTWFVVNPFHPVIRFLRGATEPVFSKVRRFIPPLGGIDFSPLAVIFILYFLLEFLVPTLIKIGIVLQ